MQGRPAYGKRGPPRCRRGCLPGTRARGAPGSTQLRGTPFASLHGGATSAHDAEHVPRPHPPPRAAAEMPGAAAGSGAGPVSVGGGAGKSGSRLRGLLMEKSLSELLAAVQARHSASNSSTAYAAPPANGGLQGRASYGARD